MNEGSFYFISDEYIEKYEHHKLMKNKEVIDGKSHNRPCYYTFKENDTGIYWIVPVSSQYEKYLSIYQEKIKVYPDYDGIVFGYVLGKKAAFLIQNMCPVIEKYIIEEYIDSATNKSVAIPDKLKRELNAKTRKAVRLYRKGTKIVFADIMAIEQELLCELMQDTLDEEIAPSENKN